MTCLRVILIDVKGRLFLSKSKGKALFPGFLPIYRMRFEPLRVPCRLVMLSTYLFSDSFVSDSSYSWIYFFAIMSDHRAEFLISSNSRGAGAMHHVSEFHLVEESICHCILHNSSYAVFVEADFLGYICIGNLTIKRNSIEDIESIQCSESARIMVLLFNDE